ncbi:MAG: hypothetical protein AAGI38_21790 [Bacteroidota bacterium]
MLLFSGSIFAQDLVCEVPLDLPPGSRAFSVPKPLGSTTQQPEILFQTSDSAILATLDNNYQLSRIAEVSFNLPEKGMSINGISRSESEVFLYYQSSYSGSALRAVAISPGQDSVRRLPLKFSTPPRHHLLRSFGYMGSFFLLYFEASTSQLHLYELKNGRRHSLFSCELELPDLEKKLSPNKSARLPLLNDYLHELVELSQEPSKLYLSKSKLFLTIEYPEDQVTSLVTLDLEKHEFLVQKFKAPESADIAPQKFLLNSLLVKGDLWQFSGNHQSAKLTCIDTKTGNVKLLETYETDDDLPSDQFYYRKIKGLGFPEKEKPSRPFMSQLRDNMALLADATDEGNLRLQIGGYSGVRASVGQYIALGATATAVLSFIISSDRNNVQTLGYEPYLMIGGLSYGLASILVRKHHYKYTYTSMAWDGKTLTGADATPNRYLRFKDFMKRQTRRNLYTASLAFYLKDELFYGYVFKGRFWLYQI